MPKVTTAAGSATFALKDLLLLLAVMAAGLIAAYAYVRWRVKNRFDSVGSFTPESFARLQRGQGATVTTKPDGAQFVEFTPKKGGIQTGKSVTFKFQEGDLQKLNLAQKILLRADQFVPGDFLTRKVLGG